MKKNMLLFMAIALVSTGTLTMNDLRAQNGPPGAQQAPPPGGQNRPGGMPPGFRNRGAMIYRNASLSLKRAKADLEKATEDYDGHRQTAIDACDKAIQELDAIQASIRAAEAAKAAAARAAAAAQQNQTPTAPATPAAPGTPAAPPQ